MSKLLVIGLGGIGIKTLLHVKKAFVDRDPQGKLPDDVKLIGLDIQEKPEFIDGIMRGQSNTFDKNFSSRIYLDQSEYISLSGNIHEWLSEKSSVEDRENLKWFDCDFFSHPLIDLEKIKSYRQIGRLAFFQQVSGRNGKVFNTLKDALTELANGGGTINVIVCGSLAGGTGAGIFMDVGSLVKKIFDNEISTAGTTIKLHGLFALPDAFRAVGEVKARINEMKPRAFGAMLELERFLVLSDLTPGSEAQYIAAGTDPVLTGHVKFFDMVWLFDERKKNPLDVPVEYGIAPSFANFITLMQDDGFSEQMSRHLVNLAASRSDPTNMDLGRELPYIGTFGTYSVELPLASIIENWACELGQEVLDQLVPVNEEGVLRDDYAGGKEGATSAKVQLGKDMEKYSSRIMKDALKMGMEYDEFRQENNQKLIQRILDRKYKDNWAPCLLTGKLEGQEAVQWDALWDSYFYDEKQKLKGALEQPIPKRCTDGDVEKAAKWLVSECKAIEDKLLMRGRDVLQKQFEIQLGAFCSELSSFINQTLNGESDQGDWKNAITNKAGKLGWMISYLKESTACFDNMQILLKNVYCTLQGKKEKVIKDIGEEGNFPIEPMPLIEQIKKDEHKQKKYLQKRQELFKIRRHELMISAEIEYLEVFRVFTQQAWNELQKIALSLRTQSKGNVGQFLSDHQKEVQDAVSEYRNRLCRVKNVIDLDSDQKSREWGLQQYNRFTQDPKNGSALKKILVDVQWQISNTKKKTEIKDPINNEKVELLIDSPNISLSIGGFPLKEVGVLRTNHIDISEEGSSYEEVKQIANANTSRLRERCMVVFEPVWEQLSVLNYLNTIYGEGRSGYTVDDFTEDVTEYGNALLNFYEIPDSRTVTYLIGPKEGSEESQWCKCVFKALKKKIIAVDYLSQYVTIDNNSSMYFISMMDMIDIRKIRAYHEGAKIYNSLPFLSEKSSNTRELCQLFQEEQNAAPYFDLDYPLSPRVVDLMKDMNKLERFITVVSLGLLQETRNEEGDCRDIQIVLHPEKKEISDVYQRAEDFIWYVGSNITARFLEETPYYYVVAAIMCVGSGPVPPDDLTIEDLWTRLDTAIPELIKKKAEGMVAKWKEEDESTDSLSLFIQKAMQVQSTKKRQELFEQMCQFSLDIRLQEKLKVDLQEKELKLKALKTQQNDSIGEYSAETINLKDEICFVNWMITRLNSRIERNKQILQ